MKLFKLDNTRKPGRSLQEFKSLVWTERYLVPGDFELVVADRAAIIGELPRGTLISHTDTREVMRVEDHEVTRNEEYELEIKITGRSFETFAENRVTPGSLSPLYDGTGAAISELSPNQAGCRTARDLIRVTMVPAYVTNALDGIPYLDVALTMRVEDPAMVHVIERGDIYTRVVEFLRLSDAGIKTTRPLVGETNMILTIHDGLDLTDEVTFTAAANDLRDASYFWTDRADRNYAAVAANTYARLYRDRSLGADASGLDRKVMYVEANDIEGTFSPPTAGDEISARGQLNLDANKTIALLQAKISKDAKPKFKIHYDVGDLVMVFGEFSSAQAMRVTEHILTVDEDGYQGYPSLSAV